MFLFEIKRHTFLTPNGKIDRTLPSTLYKISKNCFPHNIKHSNYLKISHLHNPVMN